MIGSGLLALPVVLGMAGLVPSIIGLITVWLFMTFTAFVIAGKVAEKREESFDIPSFYAEYLGNKGKWIAILANVLVLYGLLVAYLAGATSILYTSVFQEALPAPVLMLSFFVLVTAFNIFGINIVRRGNVIFMVLLFVSFVYLSVKAGGNVRASNYGHLHWIYLLVALPVLVNSFNCHNMIPIVCRSLDYKIRTVRFTIFGGIAIGFLLNIVWSIVAIGALEYLGPYSISYSFEHNLPVTVSLSKEIHSSVFLIMAIVFGLLAISTSYITVGAALSSFIRDLQDSYFSNQDYLLSVTLAFVPPLIVAYTFPHVFIEAQHFIGGFGIAVLFGVLPGIVSVKYANRPHEKWVGLLATLFFFTIVCFVLGKDIGLIQY